MSYYVAYVQYKDKDNPLRLKSLTEEPDIYAYGAYSGDEVEDEAHFDEIHTGVYMVSIEHESQNEPVIFIVHPHEDDEDNFPDVTLLGTKVILENNVFLDSVVEDEYTVGDLLRLMASVLFGETDKEDGAVGYKDIGGEGIWRVVAEVEDGKRLSVQLVPGNEEDNGDPGPPS